jgi:hypothetical protein
LEKVAKFFPRLGKPRTRTRTTTRTISKPWKSFDGRGGRVLGSAPLLRHAPQQAEHGANPWRSRRCNRGRGLQSSPWRTSLRR